MRTTAGRRRRPGHAHRQRALPAEPGRLAQRRTGRGQSPEHAAVCDRRRCFRAGREAVCAIPVAARQVCGMEHRHLGVRLAGDIRAGSAIGMRRGVIRC